MLSEIKLVEDTQDECPLVKAAKATLLKAKQLEKKFLETYAAVQGRNNEMKHIAGNVELF